MSLMKKLLDLNDDLEAENARLKELNREVRNKLNDILHRVELSPSVQFDFDEVLRLLVEEEGEGI